jgi:ferredoxin
MSMTGADDDDAEQTRRTIGELTVVIDRSLCVGFGDCVEIAPDAFVLDADGIAVFVRPESVTRECLLSACEACPVDAITVTDAKGQTLVP